MDLLPLPADSVDVPLQFTFDASEIRPLEAEILAQASVAFPAMNPKYGFAAIADDMHVGRSMVVDINHNSKTSNSQDRRHLEL